MSKHKPKIVYGQQELTPEQEAYARHFAQERIAAQLSVAPIDESEAEHHLRNAYRVAGVEPVPVRWFDSPTAFVLADVASVGASVPTVRSARLATSVVNGVGQSVWNSVKGIMWDSVDAIARASVRVIVKDSVQDVRTSVWDSVVAYRLENWFSVFRFFHEVFEKNALIHLALFNEMVSGYRLGSQEAWLVRKPIRLELDEQGRLHSADGMCLEYRDGWGFYAWHGVKVPEKIILHPEQITRQDWLTERNVEIRRVMQERLGHERLLQLMGAICIDQGQRGTLVEVDLGDDPEWLARFVQVKDSSTERQYALRVPPWIKRADEAVAWTFGLAEADYQPQQEA